MHRNVLMVVPRVVMRVVVIVMARVGMFVVVPAEEGGDLHRKLWFLFERLAIQLQPQFAL